VTWDHDRVEELLAARALDGLDPEEAALAERALIEHVPNCPRCREALDAFNAASGELALLAEPSPTPEVLDARVRQSVLRERRRGRRAAGWAVAAAASVVALGLAGWNIALNTQLSNTEVLRDAVVQLVDPQNTVVPLEGGEEASMVYLHGPDRMLLVARGLPPPDGVYRVWCVGDEGPWSAGTLDVDQQGRAVLEINADPDRINFVMVTEEPDEEAPTPSSSPVVSATVD
jgi:anti-sigma factor RsiW